MRASKGFDAAHRCTVTQECSAGEMSIQKTKERLTLHILESKGSHTHPQPHLIAVLPHCCDTKISQLLICKILSRQRLVAVAVSPHVAMIPSAAAGALLVGLACPLEGAAIGVESR